MKRKALFLAALILAGGLVTNAAPQPAQGRGIPIYRFFNGKNHFQTADYNEGRRAGMNYEGVSFSVLAQQLPGTQPLYRCAVPNSMDHFISNDGGCEGQLREGLYGFVYQGQNPNAGQAIFRCSRNGDHLSTVNPGECSQSGYTVEGQQGFSVR